MNFRSEAPKFAKFAEKDGECEGAGEEGSFLQNHVRVAGRWAKGWYKRDSSLVLLDSSLLLSAPLPIQWRKSAQGHEPQQAWASETNGTSII